MLTPYVGSHQLALVVTIGVTLESGTLWAAAPGPPEVRMIVESDSSFFITEDDVGVRFVNEGGWSIG